MKYVPERLGFLSEGAFFGEVPVLSRDINAEIRTRTVTAVTYCKLAYLTRADIAGLMERYPVLRIRINRFRNLGTMHTSGDTKRMKGQLLSDADMLKAQVLANRLKIREYILREDEHGFEAMQKMQKLESRITKVQATVRGNLVRTPSSDFVNSIATSPRSPPSPAGGAQAGPGAERLIARMATLETKQNKQIKALQTELDLQAAQMETRVAGGIAKLEELLRVSLAQRDA
jgi:CRP-like cAMP-binding protein